MKVLVRGLGTTDFSFERTPEGLSTEVYLVESRGARFYLRIAEDVGGDLASEVEIHKRLRDLGVRAPEVTYYEAFAPELERSISITTEIAGRSLMFCEDESAARQAVIEAGRDLARINQIAVNGYGWICDRPAWPLKAELDSWEQWVSFRLEDVDSLSMYGLSLSAIDTVHSVADDLIGIHEESYLAHGDFDQTPIFLDGNAYTGLIDFGEVRGAELHYDLAHFRLHDELIVEFRLLPALLRGYEEVVPLDEDVEKRIDMSAILIAARQLARWHSRFGMAATRNTFFSKYRDRAVRLIDSYRAA